MPFPHKGNATQPLRRTQWKAKVVTTHLLSLTDSKRRPSENRKSTRETNRDRVRPTTLTVTPLDLAHSHHTCALARTSWRNILDRLLTVLGCRRRSLGTAGTATSALLKTSFLCAGLAHDVVGRCWESSAQFVIINKWQHVTHSQKVQDSGGDERKVKLHPSRCVPSLVTLVLQPELPSSPGARDCTLLVADSETCDSSVPVASLI